MKNNKCKQVAVRKAVKENPQLRCKRTAGKIPAANKGLTLIELLIVISIMVMLVAVSVPAFKPMFESRRTANAADAVAAVLQTARFKAMEEGTHYGVEFIKFPGTANMCLHLRVIKSPAGGSYQSPPDLRIAVIGGEFFLYRLNAAGNWNLVTTPSNDVEWAAHAGPGLQIRFGDQGRSYPIISDNGTLKLNDNNKITLPASFPSSAPPQLLAASGITPMTFQIMQPPRSTMLPPEVLPQGMVVDLQFSGSGGSDNLDFTGGNAQVLFSPAGYVECFFCESARAGFVPNDSNSAFGGVVPNGGLIYFCVGEWDRQSSTPAGETLAEDGLNNLLVSSNMWVTIHPRTGQIRVSKNGFLDNSPELSAWKNDKTAAKLKAILPKAREYASEHYNGGE